MSRFSEWQADFAFTCGNALGVGMGSWKYESHAYVLAHVAFIFVFLQLSLWFCRRVSVPTPSDGGR